MGANEKPIRLGLRFSPRTAWSKYRDAKRTRLKLIRWVWAMHPYLLGACFALSIVQGLALVAFVVASGYAVGAIPEALGLTEAALAPVSLPLAVLATTVAFLVQYSTWPTLVFLAEDLGRRVDGDARRRLMVALAGRYDLLHIEDPAMAAEIGALREIADGMYTPGRAIGAYFRTLATWVTVIGQSAVVAIIFSPLLAGLLTATLFFLRTRMVRDLFLNATLPIDEPAAIARAGYHRNLLIGSEAAKEIRIFGLTDWLMERHGHYWRTGIEAVWKRRKSVVSRPWTWSIPWGGASTLVLVSVAYANASGQLALVSSMIVFQAGLGALNVWIHTDDIQLAHGAALIPTLDKLEDRIAGLPAQESKSKSVAENGQGLSLEDVWFRYANSKEHVLKGLSLRVPLGTSLAIVGSNGAGKTTSAKLIARLYETKTGTIAFRGTDLKDLDVDKWHRRVAAVFQDFTKFELSARENIAAGCIDAIHDLRALERAAEAAGILDLITSLPDGWNTILSSRGAGVDLSGGQWQRIAIARAMFAIQLGAEVLILDEPTASLDVRSETELFSQILKAAKGTTTILISHRFSTVRHADNICVLDDGVVAEQGNHMALMALNGKYAHMFRVQAERFAADEVGHAMRPEDVSHG